MRRKLLLLVCLTMSVSCLQAWTTEGSRYACDQGSCSTGFLCDDGVCCEPSSKLGCPTLPFADNRCSGGASAATYFFDADSDGRGTAFVTSLRCRAPLSGAWTLSGNDCNDSNAAVFPGALEIPNGLDDNCNGQIDEGLPNQADFSPDFDGDGSPARGKDFQVRAAAAPPGYLPSLPQDQGDCDDNNPAIAPNRPESCNTLDDNCDGRIDEAPLVDSLSTAQAAADAGAGFPCATGQRGICSVGTSVCLSNGQRTCVARKPETEVCDGLDNNCSGEADEAPFCGGPLRLMDPSVRMGVSRIDAFLGTPTNLTQSSTACPRDLSPNAVTPLTGGTASFGQTGAEDLVSTIWFEPADGKPWDLSKRDLALSLQLTTQNPVPQAGKTAWGDFGRFRQPVLFLCGAKAGEFIRYVPLKSQLIDNETVLDTRIELNTFNRDAGWIIGRGSGFDTSAVRRVEVLFYPESAGTYSVTVGPKTGFSK